MSFGNGNDEGRAVKHTRRHLDAIKGKLQQQVGNIYESKVQPPLDELNGAIGEIPLAPDLFGRDSASPGATFKQEEQALGRERASSYQSVTDQDQPKLRNIEKYKTKMLEKKELDNLKELYTAFGGSERAWKKLAKSEDPDTVKADITKKAKKHMDHGRTTKASVMVYETYIQQERGRFVSDGHVLKALYKGCGGGFLAWHQISKSRNPWKALEARAQYRQSVNKNTNSASAKAQAIIDKYSCCPE